MLEDLVARLVAAGQARVENGEIIGIASDGQEVLLGYINDAATEAYLQENPTPDMW